MSQPRARWRARRSALVVAVVVGALAPGLGGVEGAAAAPSPAVAQAVDAYRGARDQLRSARRALDQAQAVHDDAAAKLRRATTAHEEAEAHLAAERRRLAALSTEYFVRHGADDDVANDSMQLALSGLRERLDQAVAADERAGKALDRATDDEADAGEQLEAARGRHGEATGAADEAAGRADAVIAETGAPDLPAVAYVAYVEATEASRASHPDCHLPSAVLAGLGRITSEHGHSGGSAPDAEGRVAPVLRGLRGDRLPDTDGGEIDGDSGGDNAVGPLQLAPATWASAGTDGSGDGEADPDDLYDAATTAAELLCSGGTSLDSYDAMQNAVEAVLGQQQQAMVVLGTARRYALSTELDMGAVPPNPRGLGEADPQFDISDTNLAPGDLFGMIDWAISRVGTPYSQCLGPLARPQDPICPPGTNRFGQGFFDCSGFVSSAYRRIGLSIPATTYAMEASGWFMSSRVANRFDQRVMRPGDVFLMNGHTGMYIGGGRIIHAISGGLTLEPVPRWVANGTFAVLRPIDLLGRPAPPPGSVPIAPPDVIRDLRITVPALPDLSALLPLLEEPAPPPPPPPDPAPTSPSTSTTTTTAPPSSTTTTTTAPAPG